MDINKNTDSYRVKTLRDIARDFIQTGGRAMGTVWYTARSTDRKTVTDRVQLGIQRNSPRIHAGDTHTEVGSSSGY